MLNNALQEVAMCRAGMKAREALEFWWANTDIPTTPAELAADATAYAAFLAAVAELTQAGPPVLAETEAPLVPAAIVAAQGL